MEGYFAPARMGSAEFVDRKSRFLGHVVPCQTEEEALKWIAQIKAQHPQARHHVYAYRIRSGQVCRFTDDGEPQGTAGKPVLDLLTGRALWDVCFTVVRYFGGILLGTGGLVRAYSAAASAAAAHAGRCWMEPSMRFSLQCPYHQYGALVSGLIGLGGCEEESVFGETVELRGIIPLERESAFLAMVQEKTGGKGVLEKLEEKYFPKMAGERENLSNI